MTPAPPPTADFAQSSGSGESTLGAGRDFFSGARALPCTLLAVAASIGFIQPQFTTSIAAWPFLVALVLFGMPHGAADWSVEARLMNRTGFINRLVGFQSYLLWMAICVLMLAIFPGLSILAFLLLTVFHFGMADATAVGADDNGVVARWTFIMGRGFLLLSTAFAFHAEQAWEPFAQIARTMTVWNWAAWMPATDSLAQLARVGVGAGVLLALTGCLARASHGQWRESVKDFCEHTLVVALAYFSHPLFAIGCFFVGVHAFRHTRRLARTRVILEPPVCSLNFWMRLLRVHRLSLPLMLPTAACLLPLCWMIGPMDPRTIAVASIAFYMITTLPHHLLGLKLPAADMG